MRTTYFLIALLLVACGGSTFAGIDPDKDASADVASGDAGFDAARVDASIDASTDAAPLDSATSDTAMDECANLLADVDRLRPAARACCPACDMLQCTQTTDDICCPLSVTNASAQDVTAFSDAVRAYKAQCAPTCPGMPCNPAPSNDCDTSTSLCK